MEEIWKDIPNYEGLYQVSNLGRFASFMNVGKHKPDGKRRIKPVYKRKSGYYIAVLTKNGKSKYKYIHRLVAEAFCNNANNHIEVDHIDADKSNNKANNLRWVSPKENQSNPHAKQERLRVAKEKGIAISQYTLDGTLIRKFYSLREVGRVYPNINRRRIRDCAKGLLKQAHGYNWKFTK